jgi:hypothetical protein
MPDFKLPDFEFAPADSIIESDPIEEEAAQSDLVEEQEEPQSSVEETDAQVQEEDEQDDSLQGEEDDSPVDERYKALLEFYRDEGLIEFEGEFKGGPDDFAQLLRAQREKDISVAADNLISAIPEYAQELVELILTKQDRVTKEEITEFFGLMEQADSIPDKFDEDKAESYLIDKYIRTLKSKDKAEKYVNMLKFDGELIDTAVKEAEADREEAKAIQQQRVEQERLSQEALKAKAAEYQQALIEEATSLPWKDTLKQEAVQFIYNQGLRSATQEVVNHPKALLKLANYLMHFDPKTGDIDEELYQKQTFSKAAKKLKNDIESRFFKSDAMSTGRSRDSDKEDKNVKFVFAD